jgi:uncharacterized protein (TIGR00661 family)
MADVDVLISGIQADIELPFPVKYRFNGLSFIFGKKGGVDLLETFKKSRLRNLLKEIHSLAVEEYDLVISDFEPVSSWACYLKNKPCIALSHQAAVLNKKSPQPKHIDPIGRAILKSYAPSSVQYGFHFKSYSDNIFTPVIRKQVRNAQQSNEGHYTVYLPAYSDKRIIKILSQCEGVQWEVFSKHFKHKVSINNINVHPINNNDFISSMATAEGILCGAGFETPAEALFLNKKLMVIPMKNQFEQHCNAAALKDLGVPVMKSLNLKHLDVLNSWINDNNKIIVDYPDATREIIEFILKTHATSNIVHEESLSLMDTGLVHEGLTIKEFKALTLKKILSKIGN